MFHRPRAQRPPRLVVGLTTLLCALVLTACSGDEELPVSPEDPHLAQPSADHGEGVAVDIELVSGTGVTSGQLDDAAAEKLADQIGGYVDAWFASAYLDGPWPRTDFTDAWPRFTPGLAEQARGERAITSNAAIGADIDAVRAEERKVLVDVLAVDGKAVGATARVSLVFVTGGERRLRVTVTGQLSLTPSDQGWQVFAYQLDREEEDLSAGDGSGEETDEPEETP